MTTFSMYSASIPVFKQILNSLHAILEKAEAHATDKKIDPAALLQYRLFPDMLPFTRQIAVGGSVAVSLEASVAAAGKISCQFTDRLKVSCPYSIMQWRLPSVICAIDIYPLPHE